MAQFDYDSVSGDDSCRELTPRTMVCEIQLRTRLQDAFGQLTHDFPYKASGLEVGARYQELVARIAASLDEQDRAASQIREFVRNAFYKEERDDLATESAADPGMSPRIPERDADD